jgi:sugar lactone lactonase YvrE
MSAYETRIFITALFGVLSIKAQQYVISTFAGGVPPPTPMAGVQAYFGYVVGVVTDGAGNVYFSASSSSVFKLDTKGVMTRVAGNSRAGFSGDGGPATRAQLNCPMLIQQIPRCGVAMDARGSLYIADLGNVRIRKVSSTGIITTVAGGGTSSPGNGGPATSAKLGAPVGVAVDANGNLFIADMGDHRIRKISTTGIITTVAGNGSFGYSGDGGPAISAQLKSPGGVAVDTRGNVYIADLQNYRIRKVSTTGIITTVAGDGSFGPYGDRRPATSVHISCEGLAVDGSGNLYIVDSIASYKSVRKVSAEGVITTTAGTPLLGLGDGQAAGGRATTAQLDGPIAVAVDGAGNVYIADGSHIRKVSAGGSLTTVAGGPCCDSGDGGPATRATLSTPVDVAVGEGGNVYISDGHIRKVSATGIITAFGGNDAKFSLNGRLAVFGENGYVSDTQTHRILKVSSTGAVSTVAGNGSAGYSGDGGPATSAQLNGPMGVAVDSSGNIYIADGQNHRIRKVSTRGIITTIAGNGSPGYSGDGGPAITAQFAVPEVIAVATSGDLFVSDGHRIRKVSVNSTVTTIAGNGSQGYSGDGGAAPSAQLFFPAGLAVDAHGNLFIADTENHRIRKVSAAGVITTIAGNSAPRSAFELVPEAAGYSGDGGPATSAQLYRPMGVAVDGSGKIYIADSFNNAIRLLTPSSQRERSRIGRTVAAP